MAEAFRVRIGIRTYELDVNGHLNQAVYLQYAEHARWEYVRAAGVTREALVASGAGPVYLQNTIRYLRELRADDEVDVTCTFHWDTGRTFRVQQEIIRSDGEIAAEVIGIAGVMDLASRKLVADPAAHFRGLAKAPELIGL